MPRVDNRMRASLRSLVLAAGLWLPAGVWLPACTFSADYGKTAYLCTNAGRCPTGFSCQSGVCKPKETDSFHDDALPKDAGAEPMDTRKTGTSTDARDAGAPKDSVPPSDGTACPGNAGSCDADPCAAGGDAARDACNTLPRSCLQKLQQKRETPNGVYEIDPDGAGPVAPFKVPCDMAAGGWTTIYRDDFNDGKSSGWHDKDGKATEMDTTSNCATATSAMLGGYNILGKGFGTAQTFTLHGIPHTEVALALDYFAIDSWDAVVGQDFARVFVDEAMVYNALFDASYSRSPLCGAFFRDLGAQRVSAVTPHTAASARLHVTSTLNEGASDESYGVDNVELRIR